MSMNLDKMRSSAPMRGSNRPEERLRWRTEYNGRRSDGGSHALAMSAAVRKSSVTERNLVRTVLSIATVSYAFQDLLYA